MIFGIGLGSNMGDRLAHIRAGIAFLQTVMKPGLKVSCLYETSPVGCPEGSMDFYNAVAEGNFDGTPLELFGLLKQFEKTCGMRQVEEKNAPRALDLDLLYAEGAVLNLPELTLPHHKLHLRRFVLAPLCEIRPDLRIPGQEITVKELLGTIKNDEIIRKLGPL